MRKSEMTLDQISERNKIVQTLLSNDWKDCHKNFEEGLWAYFEVDMEFKAEMFLKIRHKAENNYLYLDIHNINPILGKGISLRITYNKNQLDSLLKIIINSQKKITTSNYKDLVNLIIDQCAETYTISPNDEDKLIRLTNKNFGQ